MENSWFNWKGQIVNPKKIVFDHIVTQIINLPDKDDSYG